MTWEIEVDEMDETDERDLVDALEAMDGIDVADADHERGSVRVEGSEEEYDESMLAEAVEELGYKSTA